MGYTSQLRQFVDQANKGGLRTNHFDKSFGPFKVKVSFGQGSPALVPWIAFLKGGVEIRTGIYPLYLYFKNVNKLILAFGVGEKNRPAINWNIDRPITITEFFKQNFHIEINRYTKSYVFKSYDAGALIEREIESDLTKILEIYHGQSTGKE